MVYHLIRMKGKTRKIINLRYKIKKQMINTVDANEKINEITEHTK
jgi:hypothetical protein